jgi:hypothetical protein
VTRLERFRFLKAPSRLVLLSSGGHALTIYHHPLFSKRLVETGDGLVTATILRDRPFPLPEFAEFMEFVQYFDFAPGSTVSQG